MQTENFTLCLNVLLCLYPEAANPRHTKNNPDFALQTQQRGKDEENILVKFWTGINCNLLGVVGGSSGNSIVLLLVFNAHLGNNNVNWRGVIERNNLSGLNQSDVLLLDFCASCSLSITNTMQEYKSALMYCTHGTRTPWAADQWNIIVIWLVAICFGQLTTTLWWVRSGSREDAGDAWQENLSKR